MKERESLLSGNTMLEILQEKIEQGHYPAGKRLPSERKLAAEFHVPQSQIHKKLPQLVESGLLECFRGNGYFVRQGKPAAEKLYKIALCWERNESNCASEDFYVGLLFNLAPEYAQNITIFNMPEESSKQNELILQLIHEEFEGIFCYPHFVRELLPAFIELKIQGIPLIFWDYSPLPGIFPAVGIDHFHSCMLAAKILAGQNMPVTYLGFQESEQNRLKYLGFHSGCRQFQVTVEKDILLPYRKAFGTEEIGFENELMPGKLYFTSTRLLSSRLIGTMFDRGYLPGKDYRILTVDRIKFMEGSSLQLDSMMRDHTQMMRKLLEEMQHAIHSGIYSCNDWRNPMRYISGSSLAH